MTKTKICLEEALNFNFKSVSSFLDLWKKMEKCYFWTPPSNASNRRSYERMHSDEIEFKIGSDVYKGYINTSCSSKNVYCNKDIYVNGEKKRITALKNIFKQARNYPDKCPKEELPLLINTVFKNKAIKRMKSSQ